MDARTSARRAAAKLAEAEWKRGNTNNAFELWAASDVSPEYFLELVEGIQRAEISLSNLFFSDKEKGRKYRGEQTGLPGGMPQGKGKMDPSSTYGALYRKLIILAATRS